jgi:hypothetical protein
MKHNFYKQRYKLEIMLQQKFTKSAIAKQLNVNFSSIFNLNPIKSVAKNHIISVKLSSNNNFGSSKI